MNLFLELSPSSSGPTVYFITPTYARHVQKAELLRISHTLLLAGDVHWIVVEDADHKSQLVADLLAYTYQRRVGKSFNYTHLNVSTPNEFKTSSNDPNWLKPRGVWQRNEAIHWLLKSGLSKGIVYFGDDDNTYDLRLFDEIRKTKKVSMFPVGLVGGLLVEKPLVDDERGKVVGFNSRWKPERKYPIDMAGFAVNLAQMVSRPGGVHFSPLVPRGYQETYLLNQLITSLDEIEPLAKKGSQILVWHTRTEQPKLNQEKKLRVPSNVGIE